MHPVVFNTTLEEALNLIGTFVFAVSGALLAVRKNYDIVGMAVLAEITAIGGGVIRDLIIGAVPPVAFTDAIYFWMPLLAVALTSSHMCSLIDSMPRCSCSTPRD